MGPLLHPKLVHLPIALAVLLPVLVTVIWLAIHRGWLPFRSWLLVVGAQALLVVTGVLAMRSGEADEDRVERIVPEAAIETHEHAAKPFVFASGAVLLLACAPFVLRKRPRLAGLAMAVTLLGGLGVLVLGYRVGSSGGDLVYRHGAAAAFTGSGVGGGAAAPARHHDPHDR